MFPNLDGQSQICFQSLAGRIRNAGAGEIVLLGDPLIFDAARLPFEKPSMTSASGHAAAQSRARPVGIAHLGHSAFAPELCEIDSMTGVFVESPETPATNARVTKACGRKPKTTLSPGAGFVGPEASIMP